MSKLDDELGGTRFLKVQEYSAQINDMGLTRAQVKYTKEGIKKIILDLFKEVDYEPFEFVDKVSKL